MAEAAVLCGQGTALLHQEPHGSVALIVGDGSTTDRYNISTINVFATAAGGIDLGLPNGVRYHDTAKTPVVTITSNTDFTAVVAGSVTVSLFYITPSEDLAGA